MFGYIYQIVNIQNGNSYIGFTYDIEARIESHFRSYISDSQQTIYVAIRKHGIENFIVKILERPLVQDLPEREKYWIKFFNTFKSGYNMTEGGNGGDTMKNHPRKDLWKLKCSLGNKRTQNKPEVIKKIQTSRKITLKNNTKNNSEKLQNINKTRYNKSKNNLNIDELIKLRQEGLSYKEIAKGFNITRQAVTQFMSRHSNYEPKWKVTNIFSII